MKPPWFLALEQVNRLIQDASRPVPKYPSQRPKEVVVNSPDIKWKPIDRVAALVVAPANWIHKPDVFKKPEKQPKKRKKTMSKHTEEHHMMDRDRIDNTSIPEQRFELVRKDSPEFEKWMRNIALNVAEELNKTPTSLTALAKATIDGRNALDEALRHIGQTQDEFNSKVKMFLTDIRSTRMASVAEAGAMTQPLKDIRQFFLGPDYTEQIRRLREFVDLCERLQALKESGFLDKISDTLLRLS